jgi:hypothetical protein
MPAASAPQIKILEEKHKMWPQAKERKMKTSAEGYRGQRYCLSITPSKLVILTSMITKFTSDTSGLTE